MGSNPTASAKLPEALMTAVYAVLVGAFILSGCAGVPGETLAGEGLKRSVRDRVFTLARSADPQCRQQKIGHTEVLEVHRDGKSAEERWTVEQCGQRLHYVVSFPPAPRASSFSVRPER